MGGFLSACKYVVPGIATARGLHDDFVVITFSLIALLGPSVGGVVVMSGIVIRPDKWSQHLKTLTFLVCTSGLAATVAVFLPNVSGTALMPTLLTCFMIAGGVYPAAQGIINTALTSKRVVEASVYQMQCLNILCTIPLPYAIGKSLDTWGVERTFCYVTMLQVLTAVGFTMAL